MKTLAEWKARLQVGTQIRQIWNYREGVTSHVFTVTQVQSNGVWGTRLDTNKRMWLDFPKRTEIVFTEQGWSRIDENQRIAEYVWVEEGALD